MLVISAIHLFLVARIEQVVRVLNLLSLLFLDELSDGVGYWLRHKLQSMLALLLVSVVKPLILIEMSIDLLDLGHLPTKMLLCLRQSVRLVSCMHFSIAFQGNFPSFAIELLTHSFLSFCIVIALLIAIVLFPSFCLSRRHHRQLRSKDAIFVIFMC